MRVECSLMAKTSAIPLVRTLPTADVRSGLAPQGRGRVLYESCICGSGHWGRSHGGGIDGRGWHSAWSMENHDRCVEQRDEDATSDECALLDAEQANDLAHTFSSRRHEYDVSTNPVCEVRAEVDVAARVQGTVQYGPCRGVHLFRSASLYGRWPVL
jgi:hypothetical protein